MKLTLVSPKKKIAVISAIIAISLLSAAPSYAFNILSVFEDLLGQFSSFFDGIVTDVIATVEEEFPEIENFGDLIASGEGGIDINTTIDNIYQELLNQEEVSSEYGGTEGIRAENAALEAENNIVYSSATGVLSEQGQELDSSNINAASQSVETMNTTNDSVQQATSSQDAIKGLAEILNAQGGISSTSAITGIETKKLIAQNNILAARSNELLRKESIERSLKRLGDDNETLQLAGGLNLTTTAGQ